MSCVSFKFKLQVVPTVVALNVTTLPDTSLNSTCVIDPASAEPVSNTPEVDSLKLITLSLAIGRTSVGVLGATVSIVKLIGLDAATFPATSVAITLMACGP